ncbi:MAG: peptide chain release factor N(5)-glutamine methyltransferase [Rhodospirillaceae bacterium]|nr:peptide chain release factor N(5)-glutamine methyltransferase [Rhodospirillaceae bacterium]
MSHVLEEVLQESANSLKASGAESPRLDARMLASAVLECSPNDILMQSTATMRDREYDRFQGLVSRRLKGEPVSRIIGVREFWSLPFSLSADTLDPRPDSETIIEAVLNNPPNSGSKPPSVLDVGTGSGCLLLALLSEWTSATGVGVDVSEGATKIARANAGELGMAQRAHFVVGDWLRSVEGRFDVIISNPPYIREDEIPALSPDVRLYDPRLALLGGHDGLDAYRKFIPECGRLLRPGGVLVFELGRGQDADVSRMLKSEGLARIETHRDLNGIVRCLSATVA